VDRHHEFLHLSESGEANMKTLKLYHLFSASRHVVIILACLLCLSQSAPGGELSDFEKDATRDENSQKTSDKDSDDDEGFWDSIFRGIFDTVIAGAGKISWYRVKGARNENSQFIKPRQPGEELIPFFRIDSQYQHVSDDVSAIDLRAEGGYGPIGVQVRNTHYREKSPDYRLDLTQVYGLYRMSFGNNVEVDFGLGPATLKGKSHNNGTSVTLPFLVNAGEWIGFEFRPSWTYINNNQVTDYDFAMDLHYRYTAMRLGYRFLHSEHRSLDGPYIGVSFRF
jgi:hypothetical protein